LLLCGGAVTLHPLSATNVSPPIKVCVKMRLAIAMLLVVGVVVGCGKSEPPPTIAPFTPEQAKQHQKAWANHLKVPVESSNSIRMKMVLIPPGEFLMGSPESDESAMDNEKPQHKVRITKPFEMAAHEVTVGQFKAFIDATGYRTEAETGGDQQTWTNPGFQQTDAHPVVWVSWNDAVAFCDWLSEKEGKTYRLPTEAEWEYACRSGSTTRWYFGDNETGMEEYAWNKGNSNSTNLVGQKLPNGFELFDMHGNVREWCSDWYSGDYYNRSPVDDPEGPSSGDERVLRSGSFNNQPRFVHSALRHGNQPTYRYNDIGFRPARTYP
jgi:formylglycine-generating enzyme required for sulfatase activity